MGVPPLPPVLVEDVELDEPPALVPALRPPVLLLPPLPPVPLASPADALPPEIVDTEDDDNDPPTATLPPLAELKADDAELPPMVDPGLLPDDAISPPLFTDTRLISSGAPQFEAARSPAIPPNRAKLAQIQLVRGLCSDITYRVTSIGLEAVSGRWNSPRFREIAHTV